MNVHPVKMCILYVLVEVLSVLFLIGCGAAASQKKCAGTTPNY